MARTETQQRKADRQLAKGLGWKDEGDGAYILGPKRPLIVN